MLMSQTNDDEATAASMLAENLNLDFQDDLRYYDFAISGMNEASEEVEQIVREFAEDSDRITDWDENSGTVKFETRI